MRGLGITIILPAAVVVKPPVIVATRQPARPEQGDAFALVVPVLQELDLGVVLALQRAHALADLLL